MISIPDALRTGLFALALSACGLTRPPSPPPLDCATVDRADERFPEVCGADASDPDAGGVP